MLERGKCKLVNMNQFGAASYIQDRISSARKEKAQLVKKLEALEQKESIGNKKETHITGRNRKEIAKTADEEHAVKKNDNSIVYKKTRKDLLLLDISGSS